MAIAVTLGSALVVVTCGTAREHTAPPATPSPEPPPPPIAALAPVESPAPPVPTQMPAAPAPEPPPATPIGPLPRTPGHEIDNFYAALRTLEKHTRRSHVRITWLGDSHGASDLWSGPLRTALQTRFGDGGPGFVHVGYKAYRHDGMKIEVKGHWATEPRGPSTALRTGDGIFGLGGVLLAGSSEGPRATLSVTDPLLAGASPQAPTLLWDLCYKPASPRDEAELTVTGLPDRTLKADAGEGFGVLRHLSFTTTVASPTLRVLPTGGQLAFCGVDIETDPATQPGVILDTLGINGARLTTPLAWEQGPWVAELTRRPPSLAVIEYGTNEAGDYIIRADAYVDHLHRLMARIHAASPDCDCLVLSPTDRSDTPERTLLVRDALRDAARASGCGFWDTYTIMGGKGSIAAWHHETPPRSGPDGVHLTPKGYNYLGEKLTADVVGGYRP